MIGFTYIDENSMGGKHPTPLDYEDVIVLPNGTVSILTPAKVAACVCALVKWEVSIFKVRWDGKGLPVAGSSGMTRNSGDEYFCSKEEAAQLVCIIDTTLAGLTTGFMRVTYYG